MKPRQLQVATRFVRFPGGSRDVYSLRLNQPPTPGMGRPVSNNSPQPTRCRAAVFVARRPRPYGHDRGTNHHLPASGLLLPRVLAPVQRPLLIPDTPRLWTDVNE